MADVQLYALQCPGCGAKLNVAKSLDVFGCSYCGASIKLAQSGGTVALELLTGHLEGVRRGTDKTAAELALRRLGETLAGLRTERDNLSAMRMKKREEFLRERFKVKNFRFQQIAVATGFAILFGYAMLYANSLMGYAVLTLLILGLGGVSYLAYRQETQNIKAIDLKEKGVLADFGNRDRKLVLQMESTTKRIAEAHKIADA